MSVYIGIDLGTASVLVCVKGKGIVLKEPSIVACDRNTKEIKAIGEEARILLESAPGNLIALRPLQEGAIADYTLAEKLIKYYVHKSLGKQLFKKPRVCISVPGGVTEKGKKTIEEAAYAVGAREVCVAAEPLVAAVGAGIDISKPCGNLIVNVGGGMTDVAVISGGEMVINTSIPIAGDTFDEAIIQHMRRRHHLLIGGRMAEAVKIKIGEVCPTDGGAGMEVQGRSLLNGLPETVTVTARETQEAFRGTARKITETVTHILGQCPPELAADIRERGIVLTGGGAMLRGFEKFMETQTGIGVLTAENPMRAVVIGTGKFIKGE